MPVDISRLAEAEKGYAAGYIDGDGTIHCGVEANGTTYLVMTITSVYKESLDWMLERFGGAIYVQPNPNKTRHKNHYKWTVKNGNCRPVLEVVEPYLVLKKKQAQLALIFCKTCYGRGHPLSNEDLSIRIRVARCIHKLNRTGVSYAS